MNCVFPFCFQGCEDSKPEWQFASTAFERVCFKETLLTGLENVLVCLSVAKDEEALSILPSHKSRFSFSFESDNWF